MKEAAITKAFVKMMAAFVTMVGKDPMIVQVRFQFNGLFTIYRVYKPKTYILSNQDS